eukprot:6236188-Alexandrium_andersonii.AAC.1
MSASLVGSEMCIRDSLSGVAVRLLRRAEDGDLRLRRRGRHPRVVACAPVSYTHLTLPTICSV